jgi:glycosyltransferase involved in cell wall biosynthesis
LWKWISRHLPNSLFELAEITCNVPAYLRLRRLLAAQSFDLIYERYAFFLVSTAVLARRYRVPFVLEANEVSGIANRARVQSHPRLCARSERFLFKRCTAILVVSSQLKRMVLGRLVPTSSIRVVPNALDVDRVKAGGKRPELVERYRLRGKMVIGFAGWFDEWDRLDFFVEVFCALRAMHADLRLLLIGDGPVVTDIKKLVADRGVTEDVIFTGPVPRDQIYDHLSLIDIAVLPHSNDFGSPVVMFEFMGLQVPIVAPRLSPIEDVHADGKTALLFAPLDARMCGRAIEELIVSPDLRHQLAQHAREKLEADHTWKRNAATILESAGLAARS